MRDGRVLLVRDRFGRWTLPKGHVEPGETDEAAALREIAEETGVAGEISRRLGETRHMFQRGGETVEKTVVYFLVEWRGGEPRPLPQEVAELCWVPAARAPGRVGYANLRAFLQQALAAEDETGRPEGLPVSKDGRDGEI